jgi:hypothetical protein
LRVGISVDGFAGLMRYLLSGIALLALMVALHEGIHGLLFWRFTGARPTFGFKGLYAYAAAPDWYLPRNQHIVVALAPLLLITLGGLVLLAVLPEVALLPSIVFVALNAGGAVGDIVAVFWLLRADASALVQDTGDAVTVFEHEAPSLDGISR